MNNVIEFKPRIPAVWCVVRNIPNHDRAHAAANRLRHYGIDTRKRGRGARKRPSGYRDYRGYQCYAGGEYQDLPVFKNGEPYSGYFSMYCTSRELWKMKRPPYLYFDYVGITDDGKLIIRSKSND